MSRLYPSLLLALLLPAGRAQAQTSLTLRADYDSFFGAYPTVQVQRPVGPTAALLAYGTYYTQADFYGLEAGVGALFGRGRRWAVQPTLAPGSGSFFLSNPAPWVSGEALVPSLTIERSWGRTECVATGAYYTALRRREANSYDFFWGQLSAGWQLGQRRTVSLAGLGALLATMSQPRNLADEQPALSAFYITRLGGAAHLEPAPQRGLAGGRGLVVRLAKAVLPASGRLPHLGAHAPAATAQLALAQTAAKKSCATPPVTKGRGLSRTCGQTPPAR